MYLDSIEFNNITYSIDMLRLKTYISYTLFTEIEFRFKTVWKNHVKMYYTSPKMENFFYNYVIDVGEGLTFWFGFQHNTEKFSTSELSTYNFTIEFNPNKIKDNSILLYLLNLSGNWFIKGFDLAMDLKVNILDIIFDLGKKRKSTIFNNGYDDKTIYLGRGDNKVKIYNKKIESNLNINYDLTRVEVSKKFDDFSISEIKRYKFDNNFPSLYLNKYIYSFSDYENKTLFAILYAVQNNFPIKDLSRTYRKKINNLFEGGYKIKFDSTTVDKILSRIIFHYFITNSKVRFK